MRTISFATLVTAISTRMGLDATTSPSSEKLAKIAEYVSSSVRSAWEIYPWPDAVVFEQRQFYPTWVTGTAYAANAVVLGSDGNYYYAKQANTSHDPVTDSLNTYWALASSYVSTNGSGILFAISLDQILGGVTKTPIGEVINVWQSDPRTNRYSTPVNWMLTNDGIVVGQNGLSVYSIPSTVWIEFTIRPPIYTSASYSNGDTVPYVIAEAVKQWTVAAVLIDQGSYDQAAIVKQQGVELLEIEWDKIEMKQGQRGRFSAMTR